jgi:uncharacterized protein YndB with AHSA1/START domain
VAVDVQCERTIPRPRAEVAAYAADPDNTTSWYANGSIDLGALKGNRGDQQYELPRRAALAGRTVVIWCRAFRAPFGSAPLRNV